jgi:hypothetical protein
VRLLAPEKKWLVNSYLAPASACGMLVRMPKLVRHVLSALLTALLITAVSCATKTPSARVCDVFIFAGQSNMAGIDSVIPDPPGFVGTEADRQTLFTCASLPWNEGSADYYPWGELKGHRCTSSHSGGQFVHGPEVGFARRLHEAGLRNLAIIKVWANFSRDVKEWPWRENGELNQLWLTFVDKQLTELHQQGFEPRVRGFVWHQGIDDAIHGRLAARYQENLTTLVAFLRRRYEAQNAPFLLARSANSPIARQITGSGPSAPMAIVRQAQVNVGETIPQAAWVDVDDLPNVVQHHFSAESQLLVGRRFGDAYLRLVTPAAKGQSAKRL